MLRAQLEELRRDPLLRAYGMCLAGTHLFTAYYWRFHQGAARMLSDRADPVCWPWLPACQELRLFSENQVSGALIAYGLLSLLTGILFLRPEWIRAAWGALLGITLCKAALLIHDFRLWGNYHYMVLWISVAYLFVRRKRELIPSLLVAFYVAAGSLKLSPEWLSGSIMGRYGPFHMSTRLLEWGCVYVVLLELAIVPLLIFSSDRRIRIAVLVQLAFFHAISWFWVGPFYPVIMLLLLGIFPLALYYGGPSRSGATSTSTWAMLGVFALAQLAPFAYPGDSALTGEGRWFALNMYDARARCESLFQVRRRDGVTSEIIPQVDGVGPRAACDPWVYFEAATNICRRAGDDPALRGATLDVQLVARRTTDPTPHRLLAISDFCAQKLNYHLFGHNPWIGY